MADVLIKIEETVIPGIAQAIMNKTGKTDPLSLPQFASEIESISGGSDPVLQDKTVTENGTVTADDGYDGLSSVTVNVESGATLNIHYGDNAPSDTSMLWCKCDEPNKIYATPTFVVGEATTQTLTETLSYGVTAMAHSKVGKKIYLFGGVVSGSRVNTIMAFDTETKVVSTLSSVLPSVNSGACACSVGTKIYIFGGTSSASDYLNTICVFDTETEDITTLSTTVPKSINSATCCSVGTKIYIFGGNGSTYSDDIYMFDTESNSITTLSATLPKAMNGIASAKVGNKIYLFGGYYHNGSSATYYDYICIFDTETNTLTTLSTVLPNALNGAKAVPIDTDVYIFCGSTSSGRQDTILKFDTRTNAISTLSVVVPITIAGMGVEAIGNRVYIVGGFTGTWSNTIYMFSLDLPLDQSKLLLITSMEENVFNVLNENIVIEMGVKSVYLGNSDGQGEYVDSYLYQNGAWTQI